MKYFFCLITIAFLQHGCIQQQPQLPSLNETFKKEDKNPFGGYIAYTQFKKLFGYRYVQISEKPFDETWRDMQEDTVNTKYSLYVLITKNLAVNNDEAEALLGFIRKGNDLFISADYIAEELLNKIHCEEERMREIVSEVAGMMKVTSVSMHGNYTFPGYKYYYYPFLNSFIQYDSSYTRILGINEINTPNYIVLFLGKGRLYLHAAPRTFSNYFLLTQSNYQYLQNILSYLRPEPESIYWDEYYKSKRFSTKNSRGGYDRGDSDNNFSSLDVINRYPSLLWAFWLSVSVIIVYILFNMKRKQRIINELKPNANTTLVFTETVGRLYLQKKDNKNISDKMITYFYEYVRNKFFMNTSRINNEFITSLAGKAGITVAETTKLFETIKTVQSSDQVTDVELLSLNQQVQNFYKPRTDGRKSIYSADQSHIS